MIECHGVIFLWACIINVFVLLPLVWDPLRLHLHEITMEGMSQESNTILLIVVNYHTFTYLLTLSHVVAVFPPFNALWRYILV